ncbi:beta-ketoacyl synthase chain length factor [Fluviicola taffensis]|uniref:3-oxoacyl-(Acyl-carrier-protein) synthase-like protein n=1 Tax=Fluviicola taffensis (strain DSM 16823 / NCIMB 13979 / RW262) TaxID=755732 RepID=F2IEB1_FLUTR|nr:beta-ketoacyl synthase chain length factor [Fluviicola taffensis]AEA43435.1 3-oxoacyl-(acyl-carrier-protein) synthase-like protein [Fluviicola taffensis DSM 16823]
MKYFIQHIESITHQNSFQQANIWDELKPLNKESELISPDYKAFIPIAALRRLSTILRMGITVSKACKEKVATEFDAISVGTSLGCLTDTEKFLTTINTVSGDILSPTAFIQSTHNTISGQISLDLKNHAYNMTHTQNALSFEVALMDGLLCIDEGKKSVLVGATDEAIPFLERLRGSLIETSSPFTTGATFSVISPNKGNSIAFIKTCEVFMAVENEKDTVSQFLSKHEISFKDIDLVLEARSNFSAQSKKHISFLDYSGYYQSASSFAVHMAHDYFKGNPNANKILIINNLESKKRGLMLVYRNEVEA